MYSFKNDYSEGAHPRILAALGQTNLRQAEGYGKDEYCLAAAELIKRHLAPQTGEVYFFSGGTQTNLTAMGAFLRPHEAAIAAVSGHILVHETGAIEATGHKVIAVESQGGKLTAQDVRMVVAGHPDEHMVKPRLVYVSNPTEIGTIYSMAELTAIRDACLELGLYLYLDGARLGSALCAAGNDLRLPDLAALCDAFYIGGTKSGALLGEALVICNDGLQQDFRYHMKQRGALLAKGRVLGIQFLELFRDDLYLELARHANDMADILRLAVCQAGYGFLTETVSNQLFPVLPQTMIEELRREFDFYVWAAVDESHSAIRLVTSWATPEAEVRRLAEAINRLRDK